MGEGRKGSYGKRKTEGEGRFTNVNEVKEVKHAQYIVARKEPSRRGGEMTTKKPCVGERKRGKERRKTRRLA